LAICRDPSAGLFHAGEAARKLVEFLLQKVHHLLVTFRQKMDYGWIHTPDRFLSLVIGW
jgi:hypothetical protein